MMRAIDAALLESKINEFVADDVNDIKHQQHREGAKYAVKRIRKIIQDVPTLDVQPVVHAKWDCVNENENVYMCSNCGGEFILMDGTPKECDMNWCCYCGAKI